MDTADELSKLKVLVKAQDRTAQQLRSELAASQAKIRDLQIQVDAARRRFYTGGDAPHPDQRREVESLTKSLENAQFRVSDIEKSLSWRITAPLRSLGKQFVKR